MIDKCSSTTLMKPTNKATLSPLENLGAGALGGALEICVQMPILTYKLCLQEGRALPTNIGGWYRGVAAQAGTVAPMTAFQFMVNGLLQRLILGGEPRELTRTETIATAAGAGIASAAVYGPVDLVTIQQQKLQHSSPAHTLRYILANYGVSRGLYRGYSACAVRGSMYTTGYLGFAPIISHHLANDVDFFQGKELLSNVVGACTSGIVSAVISHPIDTAKTCVQSDLTGAKYRSVLHTILSLHRTGGFASLYKGIAPRLIRNSGAFFIVMSVREMAIQYKTGRQAMEQERYLYASGANVLAMSAVSANIDTERSS